MLLQKIISKIIMIGCFGFICFISVLAVPVSAHETSEECQAALDEFQTVSICSLSKSTAQLTWEDMPCAFRYEVYRKNSSGKKYVLVCETKECNFLDEDVAYNTTYQYKVVPMRYWGAEALYGKGATVELYNKQIVSNNHAKYSYDEMKTDIKMLCEKYQGLVTYNVIGKTADGRNIYDVILGNTEAPKSMLVVSNIHAREYMTAPLCMNQIEYYLQNQRMKIGKQKVKNIMNEVQIHYIPMANPDGTTLSQFGIKKIKNKKLRKGLKRYSYWRFATWKANARGVDLNQNFSYSFKKKGHAGPEGYSGTKALSEAESKAIAKLTNQLEKESKLGCVINYHATGSIVFGDSAKKSLRKHTTELYNLAISETGYASAAYYRGSGHGNYREYAMYRCMIPCITIEIGRSSCPLPQSEYASVWSKNKKVVIKAAELCNNWE